MARPSHRSQVIFVGNQKGGVGKTTNCVHLAAALGAAGRRCLVWDLDANQGASLHMGIDGNRFLGSLEVLRGLEDPADVIVTPGDPGASLPTGVHLLPAGQTLEKADHLRPDALARPLQRLEGSYDYIFLDTAPNLTAATQAAYHAAAWFVLSAVPDPFAVVGLRTSLEQLQAAVRAGNTGARLLGVLFSRVRGGRRPDAWLSQRARLDRQLIDYAGKHLRDKRGLSLCFDTAVGTTVEIPRCQMSGRTLFQTKPRHRVVTQYRRLARELEDRIRTFSTTTE